MLLSVRGEAEAGVCLAVGWAYVAEVTFEQVNHERWGAVELAYLLIGVGTVDKGAHCLVVACTWLHGPWREER